MKPATISVIIFLLAGCKVADRPLMHQECFQGVLYYESGYKLAPAFRPDGTLYTCED